MRTSADREAKAIRADVDPPQVAALLALVALGVIVALDVELPIAPEALRDAMLRLLSG